MFLFLRWLNKKLKHFGWLVDQQRASGVSIFGLTTGGTSRLDGKSSQHWNHSIAGCLHTGDYDDDDDNDVLLADNVVVFALLGHNLIVLNIFDQ